MARKSKRTTADEQITEATSYGPPAAGSVKSAGRVLRILEFFDEIQRDARVAEVAERLGFPQSSTSILLNCLVKLGYMDYLQEIRSFLPSPHVTLLGTWLDKGPVRNGSLMRMLEELSHKTGDTVIIAARSGSMRSISTSCRPVRRCAFMSRPDPGDSWSGRPPGFRY